MRNTIEEIRNERGDGYGSALPSHIIYETAKGAQAIPLSAMAFEAGEIHIDSEINEEVKSKFIMLLRIAARRGMSLKIFIDSPGGKVASGLPMCDAIKAYPYDIDIYVTGVAASMAAVLAAGGRKGHRFMMPHAKMMIHEPLIAGGMGGSATSIQRTAESIIETKKIINGLLAEFTGRTIEEIDENTSFDNYFNAQEAIDFGLCDAIDTGFEAASEEF